MTRPLTDDELREIEARDAARTPGQWYFGCCVGYEFEMLMAESDEDEDGEVQVLTPDQIGDDQLLANWDFVENASVDIPRLLATVRERDQMIAELEATIQSMTTAHRGSK